MRSPSRLSTVLLLCTLCVVAVPRACLAQAALVGRDRFPQFRGLSGLGCGGYGLEADGRASLSGPVAFSVPAAYVLGHDQVRVSYDAILARSRLAQTTFRPFSDSGANGTLSGTFGHTFGRVNVAVSDIVLSRDFDQAWNVQLEPIPPSGSRLAWSVGVQDMEGGGGSSGTLVRGDDRVSRSVFATFTGRLGGPERPFYVTAGVGTRRFANGFAAASCRVARAVRLWAEYDGFGANLGLLLAWHHGRLERPWELTALVALVDGRYPTLGAGFGF